MTYHTPYQIELGFQRLGHTYDPNTVATTILRGRFGYRRGIKAKLAPPNATSAPQEGGTPSANESPSNSQDRQAQAQLLETYLLSGTLPPETSD